MNRYKAPIFEGALTYLCEGNSNPHSKSYSRKLHLSPSDNVLIGRGYNITTHTNKQIIDDFTSIGITYKKAELLCKGTNLRGIEAQKFIRNNKNEISLTPEQESKLFEMEYERLNAQLSKIFATSERRYGVINEDQIQQFQWEILIDFLFTGDLHSKTQDMLIVALKKSIDRENPQIFELLLMDVEYWKKTGIAEDRAKMRAIFVREWEKICRMLDNTRHSQAEEPLTELLFQSPNIFTIQGFFIDNDIDNLNMLIKRHSPHPHIKTDPKDDGATFGDLVLCLKVFYDFNIVSRMVGGSLNPSRILQGDTEGIYKEFYPDQEQGKKILECTRFAEIFSEASLILAQIASGHTIKRKGDRLERGETYEYPDELKTAGVLPLDILKNKRGFWTSTEHHNKTKNHLKEIAQAAKMGIVVWAKSSSNSMIKFWLVAHDYEEVQTGNSGGEYYVVKDVKLGVEAYKLVVSNKGEFREMPIEDPDDPALLFAKICTDNIEMISKHFPIFKRIKQIYKSLMMAQWLFNRKIPIDMSVIKEFYQRELLHMATPQQTVFNARSSIELKPPKLRLVNVNLSSLSPIGTPTNAGVKSLNGSIANSPTMKDKFSSPTAREHHIMPVFSNNQMEKMTPYGFKTVSNKFYIHDRSSKNIAREEALPLIGNNHKLGIFAGVMLDFKHRKGGLAKLLGKMEQNNNNNESKDSSIIGKFQKKLGYNFKHNESMSNSNRSSVRSDALVLADFEHNNVSSISFPFQKATCVVCQSYLRHSEVMKPANGNYYCRLHHPLSCNYCFSIIKEQVVTIEDEKYHPYCLKCRHCGGPLKEKLIKTKEGFIHSACMGDYLRELCEANKLNELFVADDDDKGNNSPRTRFTSIMKKKDTTGTRGYGTERVGKVKGGKKVQMLSRGNSQKDIASLENSIMSHRSGSPS